MGGRPRRLADGTGRTSDQALADLVEAGGTATGSEWAAWGWAWADGRHGRRRRRRCGLSHFSSTAARPTDPVVFTRGGQGPAVVNPGGHDLHRGPRRPSVHRHPHRRLAGRAPGSRGGDPGMGERFDAPVTLRRRGVPAGRQARGKSGTPGVWSDRLRGARCSASPDASAGTALCSAPWLADLTPADAARLPAATTAETQSVPLRGLEPQSGDQRGAMQPQHRSPCRAARGCSSR